MHAKIFMLYSTFQPPYPYPPILSTLPTPSPHPNPLTAPCLHPSLLPPWHLYHPHTHLTLSPTRLWHSECPTTSLHPVTMATQGVHTPSWPPVFDWSMVTGSGDRWSGGWHGGWQSEGVGNVVMDYHGINKGLSWDYRYRWCHTTFLYVLSPRFYLY